MHFRAVRSRAKAIRAGAVLAAAVVLGLGLSGTADASVATTSPSPTASDVGVAVAAMPDGDGYWIAAPDGGVYAFGAAKYYGSALNDPINGSIVGIESTPDGKGYWLVASGGGIYTFGDAGFYGSANRQPIVGYIVGMAPTPDGKGYWEVASGGGVYTFGDAGFYGSARGKPIVGSIVGISATSDGHGYRLAASGGGVYDFGDAAFYGSARGKPVCGQITGITTTPDSLGYRLVESCGGVFDFGDARFYGSANGRSPIDGAVGMAASPDNGGYWLVAGGGGVYTYGNAHFYGSAQPFSPGSTGYDVGNYACSSIPAASPSFAVVEITGWFSNAQPNASASCLQAEAAWAGSNLTTYMFMVPDPASGLTTTAAYDYGYTQSRFWISYAKSLGIVPHLWWLDVEWASDGGYSQTNSASTQATNSAEIEGAVAGIHSMGAEPGIYSTSLQWGSITGNQPSFPGIDLWMAGASGIDPGTYDALNICADSSAVAAAGYAPFAGGKIILTQYARGTTVDQDYACT